MFRIGKKFEVRTSISECEYNRYTIVSKPKLIESHERFFIFIAREESVVSSKYS